MTTALELLAVVLIVLGNAFFVSAEYALVTARRTRMQELAEDGSKSARRVLGLQANPARFISAIQLGITLSSLALGAIGEPVVSQPARVPARPAAGELAPGRLADHLGDPRVHDPVLLPRGGGRDRAEVVHAGSTPSAWHWPWRCRSTCSMRCSGRSSGCWSRPARSPLRWLGLPPGARGRDRALGGGAEDARPRQPRGGRARGGGAGDAPQRLRVRRQGRRRRDGAAPRRGRAGRRACRCREMLRTMLDNPYTRYPGVRGRPGRHRSASSTCATCSRRCTTAASTGSTSAG